MKTCYKRPTSVQSPWHGSILFLLVGIFPLNIGCQQPVVHRNLPLGFAAHPTPGANNIPRLTFHLPWSNSREGIANEPVTTPSVQPRLSHNRHRSPDADVNIALNENYSEPSSTRFSQRAARSTMGTGLRTVQPVSWSVDASTQTTTQRTGTRRTGTRRKTTTQGATADEFARARQLERDGEIQTAFAAYRALADAYPDHPLPFHRLAVLHDRTGDYEQAEAFYTTALQLAPRNAQTLCDFGYSRYLRQDDEAAELLLKRAIAMDPQLQRAHANLALVHARRGDRQAAIEAFRRAGMSNEEAQWNLRRSRTAAQLTDEAS